MDDQQQQQDLDLQKRLVAARAHAIGEAMREVMGEQQPEIIKRARAKLLAMGIHVADDEVEGTQS